MDSRQTYSDVAPASVPVPTVRRRDRVLFALRHADGPLTVDELVEHLKRNRLRDYNRGLAYKDVERLERAGFIRDRGGHPRRFEAK